MRRIVNENGETRPAVVISRKEMYNKPGGTKAIADAEIRKQFVHKILEQSPTLKNVTVVEMVKKEYGIGIDGKSIRAVRKALGLRVRRAVGEASMPKKHNRKPTAVRVNMGSVEETIRACVDMLMKDVPNLHRLIVENRETGLYVKYDVMSITSDEMVYDKE